MATLEKIRITGAAAGTVDVPSWLADATCTPALVHQVMVAHRNAARAGTANTLTKSEVRLTGAKPWRQKGTGRARAGYAASPVWRGGSVVFGPRPRSYRQKVDRAWRRAAARSVLASRVRDGAVACVDSWALDAPKTKTMAGLKAARAARRLLCVGTGDITLNAQLSGRNIPGVTFVDVSEVDAYTLLTHDRVVVSEDAWEALCARLETGKDSKSGQEARV